MDKSQILSILGLKFGQRDPWCSGPPGFSSGIYFWVFQGRRKRSKSYAILHHTPIPPSKMDFYSILCISSGNYGPYSGGYRIYLSGCTSPGWGYANLLFGKILDGNYMQMKECGRRGNRTSLVPLLDLPLRYESKFVTCYGRKWQKSYKRH